MPNTGPHTKNNLHCSAMLSSPFSLSSPSFSLLLSASPRTCSSSWLLQIYYQRPSGRFFFSFVLCQTHSFQVHSHTMIMQVRWTCQLVIGRACLHPCLYMLLVSKVQDNAVVWSPAVDSWCWCPCSGTVFCLQGELSCPWRLFVRRWSCKTFSQKLGLIVVLIMLVMVLYTFLYHFYFC